jgi:hypothetical protein
MEEEEAPCKTPAMVEEVEVTCKISTKVDKSWRTNKKNLAVNQ